MKKTKFLTMVCGSNGAGKSTLTYRMLKDLELEKGEVIPFIDPDRIAKSQELSPIEAGKATSREVKKHILDGVSFIKESTLTSNFDFQMIQLAKDNGFKVNLVYVGIKSANYAIFRIKTRLKTGGHFVPDEDVKRRYSRSLSNLPKAIAEVDTARIIDNSTKDYKEVASFEKCKLVTQNFTPEWFKKPLEIVEQLEISLGGNISTEDLLSSKIRPQRAIDWEKSPSDALEKHPELDKAYAALRDADAHFTQKFPGNPAAQKKALDEVKKRIQKTLDTGELKSFGVSYERSRGQEAKPTKDKGGRERDRG